MFAHLIKRLSSLVTNAWGVNTFPVHKYNSRTFHLKFVDHVFFWFFRHFPQINVDDAKKNLLDNGCCRNLPFNERARRKTKGASYKKENVRKTKKRFANFEDKGLIVVYSWGRY